MQRVRIISFDAEGTLASHAFSHRFWQETVPMLLGQKERLPFDRAAEHVFSEYQTIGPNRPEWFDIGYWFRRFELGDPIPVIERYRFLIEFYPETESVLRELSSRYQLVVASTTPFEFLRPLLRDVEHAFVRYFSATSLFGRPKDEAFFRHMCVELDAAPSEVLHVGDNWSHDYLSSSAAGLTALYLDRSRSSNGCLHSLSDLLSHLPGDS